mgnify:FL=1
MSDIKSICLKAFEDKFGTKPQMQEYAPGRVNIIGEHTDYNGGFVLPCAIKYGTCMVAKENGTNKMRILAVDMNNDYDEFEIASKIEKYPSKLWVNYLRGVTYQLAQKFGDKVKGLDIAIKGDVPPGAGLSSSASLEVCFGHLVSSAFGLNVPLMDIALMGQAAEAYIGMKCGIMDQAISANGTVDHLVRIDCKSYGLTQVAVPKDLVILIINSNIKHQLVGSEYNDRRESCEKAASIMGVSLLRDATMEMLEKFKDKMDDVTYRRARHVITEDQRVLDASKAFESGDLKTLAKLMYASHVSMRDDFEITVKETDALVEIVKEALGEEYAAVRQTGGGFGGCVVAVVEPKNVQKVKDAVNAKYKAVSGIDATIFETTACAGATFTKL